MGCHLIIFDCSPVSLYRFGNKSNGFSWPRKHLISASMRESVIRLVSTHGTFVVFSIKKEELANDEMYLLFRPLTYYLKLVKNEGFFLACVLIAWNLAWEIGLINSI